MATMVKVLTVGRVAAAAEHAEAGGARARNILLFLAAPWIALAYLVAFPFVGFAALIKALVTR